MTECVFCSNAILESDENVTLTAKGVDGILKASEQRKDSLNVAIGQSAHVQCRKHYINPKALILEKRKYQEDGDENQQRYSLRSKKSFSYRENCILCGCPDLYSGRKKGHKLIPIGAFDFHEK